ncbi:MAG: ATP-binding protein [Nitrospinae bacterium]|nr:ATP-binding protein [Nitrospinota bacterium]
MNAQSLRQLAVTGVLTLILGVALLNFIVGHQHRQILRKGFLRLRRYTNTILENLGSGVLAVTPDGMIEVCNREAARLLRTTADQSIGQPVRDLSPDIARLVADTVKQRGGITPARRFAQDGSAETWAIQTSFLGDTGHNGEEREDACIVIVDDVTAQVRLEGQVRHQEKLAAMGTLASTVAHEIRNPLNAIGIIAQLLDRRYSPQEAEPKYRDYFTSVTREIARINDIVEQFIRFARPPKLDLQPIDFPGLLRDIENLYRETFTGANIRWRVTADPHQATEADASKIKQVVINLVKNAWEAIHEDGEITVTGRAGDDDYTIIVTDNGEGMDAETRSRIFDIYYTKKKDGTGIGLALVHQIVSQHGGTITVDSTPGQGTTCTLRFPCQRVAEVI